jgi:hypothetical protein
VILRQAFVASVPQRETAMGHGRTTDGALKCAPTTDSKAKKNRRVKKTRRLEILRLEKNRAQDAGCGASIFFCLMAFTLSTRSFASFTSAS